MYLLNVEEYDKVLEPLRQVPFNTLFAQSVVLRKIKGAIYVDHLSSPSAFYIIHPYGMSLLCGSTDHLPFLQALKNYLIDSEHIRRHPEWLQVFPDGWNRFIRNLINSEASAQQEGSGSGFDSGFGNLSDRDGFRPIRENTRVNFTFDRKAFEATGPTSPKRFDIVPTSAAIFEMLNGTVSPKHYWNDAEHFLSEGIGFSLMQNDEPVSTAFSAFRIGRQMEIGIETLEHARGKGYAIGVCRALITYCIENGLEPVWSCRRENEASYTLAQNLGFVPSIHLPYYRLDVFLPIGYA